MKKEALLEHCLVGLLGKEDRFDRVPPELADWVCERLAFHKVLPMAAAFADPRRRKCPPLAHAFRAAAMENAVREAFYHSQAAQVFSALDKAGLDYIPFKGPFWGCQMVAAYHWRHIGDMDLLLSKPAAQAAAAILTGNGYQADPVEGSVEAEFAVRGELALMPRSTQPHAVPVELHWDLMPSPRFLRKHFLCNDDFFEHTTAGQWQDLAFRLPAPEIQLIYYLLHATCQHQFMRFVHIANIVHFIQAFPDLNWHRMGRWVVSRRAQTPVYAGLKMARAFYPLPAHVDKWMAGIRPKPAARMLGAILSPGAVVSATRRRGRIRRKLFRYAMSL